MGIFLDIPEDCERQLREALGDALPHAAIEAMAIQGYTSGNFGAATLARLLGHSSRWETEALLVQRKIPLNYTLDDLEADRETLDSLFRKSA